MTTFGVSRVQAFNLLVYLTATSGRHNIDMEIRRRLRSRGIFKKLMLQKCIEFCAEFSPSLQLLNNLISPSNPIPPTIGTECTSGRYPSSSFTLSPLQFTDHHIRPGESGSALNEHNGEFSINSNSFLN